jgi:hypothetical protein
MRKQGAPNAEKTPINRPVSCRDRQSVRPAKPTHQETRAADNRCPKDDFSTCGALRRGQSTTAQHRHPSRPWAQAPKATRGISGGIDALCCRATPCGVYAIQASARVRYGTVFSRRRFLLPAAGPSRGFTSGEKSTDSRMFNGWLEPRSRRNGRRRLCGGRDSNKMQKKRGKLQNARRK